MLRYMKARYSNEILISKVNISEWPDKFIHLGRYFLGRKTLDLLFDKTKLEDVANLRE